MFEDYIGKHRGIILTERMHMLEKLNTNCVHGMKWEYSCELTQCKQEHAFTSPDEIFLSSFRQGMCLFPVYPTALFLRFFLIGDKVRVFNDNGSMDAIVTYIKLAKMRVICNTNVSMLLNGKELYR